MVHPFPDEAWGEQPQESKPTPAPAPLPHASFQPKRVIDCRGQSAPAGLMLGSVARVEVRWLHGYGDLLAVRLGGLEADSSDFVINASDLQKLGEFMIAQGKQRAASIPLKVTRA